MQAHTDIYNLPKFRNAAITIGTFDGVHTGHLKIIEQLKKEAILNNGESVIITFDPHPRMVVGNAGQNTTNPIFLLNTLEEKKELLANQGIDHLVIVPFTKEFSELSAEDYIHHFLVETFRPATIIIGYDHHFGKERGGNYKLLEKYAGELNYTVKEIPQYILEDITISSTKIRDAIKDGDVNASHLYLGYDYYFSGEVVNGDKIGRTLGYPTANLKIDDDFKLIPGNGIYIVEAEHENKRLQGMMSIGFRPTVGGTKRTIEVNLFDFNEEIYGVTIKVILKKYIRKELKFEDLNGLILQMKEDEKRAKQFFENQP